MSRIAICTLLLAAAAGRVQAQSAEFTLRIENVSTPATLMLSNGESAPAPTAPLLWMVHTGRDLLFTPGRPDRGQGLEMLAEDGNPATVAKSLSGQPGVAEVGTVSVPVGASAPGPILPGLAYVVHFNARVGERLTLATMFGQSNDLFYAPEAGGIVLFDDQGMPLTGDITSQLVLWDAGTEVNQEPGLGPDQAPRQAAPNTGMAEGGVVRAVRDGFRYPPVRSVLRVTIESRTVSTGGN